MLFLPLALIFTPAHADEVELLAESAVQKDAGEEVTPEESELDKNGWIEKAETSRLEDDRDGVLRALDGLYENFPHDPDTHKICGDTWLLLGEWDRLRPLLDQYEDIPDDAHATMRQALRKVRSQDWFHALVLLEAAFRAAPEDPAVLLNLGAFYCEFQYCSRGTRFFRQLTVVSPDDPKSFLALAQAARRNEDAKEGVKAVLKAESLLEKQPAHPLRERMEKELQDLMAYFMELELQAAEESPD